MGQRTAFRYFETRSLDRISSGIYAKRGDKPSWLGVVRLLQEEINCDVHVGGFTALALQGSSHQLPLGGIPVELVSFTVRRLPKWVHLDLWDRPVNLQKSSLFAKNPELEEYAEKDMRILVSSRELAILEYFDAAKISNSLESLENQLAGLMTLRSSVLQDLLEKCQSIKVKRLFLYLSEKMEMPFFGKLNLSKINCGTGKRVIVQGGVLDTKYLITVPARVEENPF